LTPQQNAHRKVAYAVRRGVLVKPKACERCGKSRHVRLSGHHADYSKPLDVKWLCHRCHSREHTLFPIETSHMCSMGFCTDRQSMDEFKKFAADSGLTMRELVISAIVDLTGIPYPKSL
jgi:ribosomal protein S27AE